MDVQKTMEFIVEQLAHVAALQAKNEIEIGKTERVLRYAIELTVLDARHERRRRRELGLDPKRPDDGR